MEDDWDMLELRRAGLRVVLPVDKKTSAQQMLSSSSGVIPPEEESRATCEGRFSGKSSAFRKTGGLPKTLRKRDGFLLVLQSRELNT